MADTGMIATGIATDFSWLYFSMPVKVGTRYTDKELDAILRSERVHWSVAYADAKPCGIVLAYDMVTWMYVDVLYVLTEFRNRGHGKGLLDFVAGKGLPVEVSVSVNDRIWQWCHNRGFEYTGAAVWGRK